MTSNDEILHVEETVLRGLWEMVHEEHRGKDIATERLCDKPTCLAFRGMFMDSVICGGAVVHDE